MYLIKNKSTYLLLLLLIGLKFFNYYLLAPIFNYTGVYELILGLYLYYGYYKWGRGNSNFFKKELKYWYWILIGICSSMIPIFIMIGQSPIHSIWIYRSILIIYCCLPVLLFMRFSYQEIISATYRFSIIYAIVFTVVAKFPYLVTSTFDQDGEIKLVSDTDYGYSLSGIPILLFPLYSFIREYSLCKLKNKWLILKIVFLLSLLFFIQNRSVLFPALLISLFFLLRKTSLRIIIILCVTIITFIPKLNPINNLIEQTEQETSSEDYNRNIAYTYYLSENFASFSQFLFGTGIESTHLSNQKEKNERLYEMGIFSSDVGFLGFMNIYGVIPIIVFIIVLLKPLIHWSYFPLDVKLMSIHILICSLTISYFESFAHAIWFILYFVLMTVTNKKYILNNKL